MEGKEKEDEFDRKAREVTDAFLDDDPHAERGEGIDCGLSLCTSCQDDLTTTIATTLRDQHERDLRKACAVLCYRCANTHWHLPPTWREGLGWRHQPTQALIDDAESKQLGALRDTACSADAIRRAFAASEEGR